ncbi:MAG: glycerol kinase GlpK [Clostridia bacterium]|nr:glycerol kinase GlpK [Clostridia bacterium]
MSYIIGLDVGTTSVRSCVYGVDDGSFSIVRQKAVEQIYPHPDWVEEEAEEIYLSTYMCLTDAFDKADGDVLGISLTNMRETVVCWDSVTGKPFYNAIIWQCRRTKDYCESLPKETKKLIYEKTGLVVDAYFSASKIKYLIDNVPKVKEALMAGRLRVGTVDSYIVYRLTGGRNFVTDITNASRTMLFNIHTLSYDEELLSLFGIPRGILPEVYDNDKIFGYTDLGGKTIPIAGVIGDQQSALFGQNCLEQGSAKVTYGTGLFMLFNTGDKICSTDSGLLSTIAYKVDGKVTYALEGSVFNAGTAIQFLRDNLGMITTAAESEALARSVDSADGVCFVPAFTGLGAPYWKSDAKGLICGLTRGSTKAHVVRAALEAMAYAARELFDIMQKESDIALDFVKADGGASENKFLMQFQSDQLQVPVKVPANKEATVLGSVKMCLKALGLNYKGEENLSTFTPEPRDDEVYYRWLNAVKRCIF